MLEEREKEILRGTIHCLFCGRELTRTLLDFMQTRPGDPPGLNCEDCNWEIGDNLAREMVLRRLIDAP